VSPTDGSQPTQIIKTHRPSITIDNLSKDHHKGRQMRNKKAALFGIYPSVAHAERAVNSLIGERFSDTDVSVLLPANQGSRDFAYEKRTNAPEGTITAVATGGTIGGTLGLLAGIGALAIPGLGPFVAAGPIRAVLASPGVGGTGGGLVGALVGMGIPEYDAKRYEGRVKNGGILLSAHCDTSEEITRAKETLKRTGAEDIASTGEKTVGGYATSGHDPRRDVADHHVR
jgi:hypothetical protein